METIPIPGAEIYYEEDFLPAEEATILFNSLRTKCAWQRHRTSFNYAVPRDEAYYGDPGTTYTYSRREYKPLAWIPELLSLRSRVEAATPAAAYSNLGLPRLGYNAVLCNLYRNGNDSVGLHADAEPEMGPVIASVSLGVERLFRLKGKNGTVVLKLKTSEFKILTRSETQLSPPSSCEELTGIALKLRERVDLGPQQRYRLVGVGLSNFRESEDKVAQPVLFE